MTGIPKTIYPKNEIIGANIPKPITATNSQTTTSVFDEQNQEVKNKTSKDSSIDERLDILYKKIEEIETRKKENTRAFLKKKATSNNIEKAKEKVFEMLNKWGNNSEYEAIDKLTDEDIILAFSDSETAKATENEFRKFSLFINKQGLGKLYQRLIEISEKCGVEPYGGKKNYIKSQTPEIAELYGLPMKYDMRVEKYLAPHYRMYKEDTNYAELYNKIALKILDK